MIILHQNDISTSVYLRTADDDLCRLLTVPLITLSRHDCFSEMFFLPFRSSFLPQFKATLEDYEPVETGDWRRFLDMNDCIIEKMLSTEPEPANLWAVIKDRKLVIRSRDRVNVATVTQHSQDFALWVLSAPWLQQL